MDIHKLQGILRDNAIHDKRIALAENKKMQTEHEYVARENDIYNKLYQAKITDNSYMQFKKDVMNGFVTEAILCLVNACIDNVILKENYNQALSRQLVSNLVKQEGASNLLNRFKRTSYLLSEMAYVCESTIKSVLEKADKNDKSTFKINPKDKEQFFEKLDKVDADAAIDDIRNRVQTATEEFIDTNFKSKMDIEKTMSDTKNKVEQAKEKRQSQNIQEAYVNMGKAKIAEIRSNKIQSVYEAMVYNLSRSAMKNEEASKVFVENASLNMDKITEHCEVMYTFLTVMDACKIMDINENYIAEMLEEMKK